MIMKHSWFITADAIIDNRNELFDRFAIRKGT